jgi:MFS family permease
MTAPAEPPDPTPPRLFTRAFVALSVAEFAYFTADGLAIPVTPLFAAGPLNADAFGVGLAVGAFGATALVLRPIAGRTADRRGRRPLLIGGALLYAAAMAAHVLVTDLAMLVGLRLLLGVGEAFFFVAGFAALADLAPPGRTGEALSINSLSLYLGIAFGPLVGQVLIETGGFTLAWLGGAALAVLAAGIATQVPETVVPDPAAEAPPLINRAVLAPSAALFSGIAAMAGFFAFIALRAVEVGLAEWSAVLVVFGLVVVATRILFAKLPDRVPPFRLATGALVLTALGLVIAGAIGSVAGLFAAAVVLAIGVAFTTPAFFSAILARVRPSERGAAFGTATAFIDLAFGGGPVFFGLIAGAAGIPAAFIVGAILPAVGAVGTAALAVRQARAPTTG